MIDVQQQAQELVDRFYNIFVEDEDEHYIGTIERISKESALIAVDEMIKHHDSLFYAGLKNVHQAMNTPIEIYNDVMNPSKQRLLELKNAVKQIKIND